MKQEFKWTISIELDVEEDEVGTNDPERLYDSARYAFERAQDRFFDELAFNDDIRNFEVLKNELE